MLRFHLQHCAISHHNTIHRLLISSSDFIVMASCDNLFKTKPFSIPSIPISPFSLQTLELFHSRRVLSSNNSSKPTSSLSPFSIRNSGFSYAARPKASPAVSLEMSTPLSSRLSVLTKRLTKLGFKDCEYMPGQYNHLLCPMCKGGHSGKTSLSLHISKDGNSAAWICFHGTCGWQGNTMAFVNAVSSNGKLNQTMKSQSSYEKLNQTVKAEKRELIEKNLKLEPLSDKLLAYFAERMISAQTLQRNHVMQKNYGRQIVIAFTYKRNGALVGCKYRAMSKRFWREPNAEKIFYGLDDIKNASDIIIVEGEIDKLAMEEAGFRNCVSVPNGAPAKVSTKDVPVPDQDRAYRYLWNCEYIEKASRIILATDGDPPGHALAEELARRLGRERCRRVKWPKRNEIESFKDANEVLMHLGPEFLKQAIENAEPYPNLSIA